MVVIKRYASADQWLVSVGGEELISIAKQNNAPEYTIFQAFEFDFYNKQDCVIRINNSQDRLIPAMIGVNDTDVHRFEVVTPGVEYIYNLRY